MHSLPTWVYSIASGLAVGAPIWVFIFRQHVSVLKEKLSLLEATSAPELARQVNELSKALDETTGKLLILRGKVEQSGSGPTARDTKSFKDGLQYGVASTLGQFVRLVRWGNYQIENKRAVTVPDLLKLVVNIMCEFQERTLDPLLAGQEPKLPSLDLSQPEKPWNR